MQSTLSRSSLRILSLTTSSSSSSSAATKPIGAVRFYPAITSTKDFKNVKEPEKSVFISQSKDIYTNLALEHWLYRNTDFSKHRVLLLWQSDPCVTIGRHQNPWTEVDLAKAKENGVNLVRRPSGGGSAYYDQGNLNCTFFSPGSFFDRKSNLDIICKALKREFNIQADITPGFDFNVGGFMIGGGAAKMSKNAYDHCTLMVDGDLKNWSDLLKSNIVSTNSRAINSVEISPVKNLNSLNPKASIKKTLSAIGYEFLRTSANGGVDGGEKMIESQRGFKMINPTEDWFPGLDALKTELKGWSWTFGATPECTYQKEYVLKNGGGPTVTVTLNLNVRKGFIQSASLELPADKFVDAKSMSDLSGFIDAVKLRPFHADILVTFEQLLLNKSSNRDSLTAHNDKLDQRQYNRKLHNSYGL